MKNKPYKKRALGDRPLQPSTLMMGYGYDPKLSEGSLKPPIFMTSTFAFDIRGGEAEAFRVLDHLQIIKLAVSLGGTESLMEHPFAMTHSDVPDDDKRRLGVTESMLRISVGIEDVDDLIADLDQALAAM